MQNTAVITGAGTGVGRAVAIELAARNWNVVVLGRNQETLSQTARLAHAESSDAFLTLPCDIQQEKEVGKMAESVLHSFGRVDVLVNSAGTNTPRRSLAELGSEDYRRLMQTNLDGAYFCVQAFLPIMRKQKNGTIVNIVSDAAKQANAKAGPAYVMSKFGMAGLTQSINAEEKQNGIRACAIFPGDIDTPLLELRPNPPNLESRKTMLQPEDIAACVMTVIELPARAIVEEILIRPR